NLTGADLSRVDLNGAKLTGATLAQHQLLNTQHVDKAILPQGLTVPPKGPQPDSWDDSAIQKKLRAELFDRVSDGQELKAAVEHLMLFYQDEQDNGGEDRRNLIDLDILRRKQQELAEKVMEKAQEFTDWKL